MVVRVGRRSRFLSLYANARGLVVVLLLIGVELEPAMQLPLVSLCDWRLRWRSAGVLCVNIVVCAWTMSTLSSLAASLEVPRPGSSKNSKPSTGRFE